MRTRVKLLSIALCTAIVTGCQSGNDTANDLDISPVIVEQDDADKARQPADASDEQEASEPYTEEEAEAVAAEFQELAESAVEVRELIAFMDRQMSRVGQQTADGMLETLEAAYRTDLEKLNETFMEREVAEVFSAAGYHDPASQVKEHISDQNVLALIGMVEEGRYKLATSEGVYYPIIDYAALHQAYGQQVSPDWNAYLQIMAVESEQPAMADAAIIVPWSELAKRTLQAEQFLADYPDSKRAGQARGLLWRYMNGYFFGSSNTDITGDGGYVKEQIVESYRETSANHPDSLIGQMSVEFLSILDEHGGKLDWADAETEKQLNRFRGELEDRAE